MLVRRLEQFQAASAISERNELREEAHKLTSSAGPLGFRQFSEDCGRLETAIKDGEPIEESTRPHVLARPLC